MTTLFCKFKLWGMRRPDTDNREVFINPDSVSSFEELGHVPPCTRIYMKGRASKTYDVEAKADDVRHRLEIVSQNSTNKENNT